jgi:hypothetical protein
MPVPMIVLRVEVRVAVGMDAVAVMVFSLRGWG